MGRKRRATEWEIRMAQNLKRLRERAGLTQPQLAAVAGVPVGSLRCWEQATRMPLLYAAAKLAKALGVTLDELTVAVEITNKGTAGRRP
jgi:transcriptional regulator with XRE-family HTH domain